MLRSSRSLVKLKPILEDQTLISFVRLSRVKALLLMSNPNNFVSRCRFHTGTKYLNKDQFEDDSEIKLPFYEFEKTEEKNKKSFIATLLLISRILPLITLCLTWPLHRSKLECFTLADEDISGINFNGQLITDFVMTKVKLYQANFKKGASHIDFIKIALRHMEEFNVQKDLDSYKALVCVLPTDVYVAKNRLLVEMVFHPKEQLVIMDLLVQMGHFSVIPDMELKQMLEERFGKKSHPCKLLNKIFYWSVKFKNKSPWLLPSKMPSDGFLLGKMAIERITSVDIQTEITVFQTENVPNSIDKTWIVSGQSPKQKELLKKHSPDAPVIVEGGDIVWLRDKCVSYFILKADTEPLPFDPPPPIYDLAFMKSPYMNLNYKPNRKTYSVHEQDDGIIYAVCATGTSSKDSLLSWVRLLQEHGNPVLGDLPVLFRFRSATKEMVPTSEALVQK